MYELQQVEKMAEGTFKEQMNTLAIKESTCQAASNYKQTTN